MTPGSIVRRKIKYDMKASSAITLKLTLLSEVAILLKTISRGIMVYFLQTDTEIVIIRILSQHQDASRHFN